MSLFPFFVAPPQGSRQEDGVALVRDLASKGGLALVGSLLFLGWVMACSQQELPQAQETPMQDKTIEAVLKEHRASLLSLPGVIGAAQGECAGKPCIKVFVSQKTDALLGQIPPAIEGFAVEIQETGEIRAIDPGQ